MENRHQAFPSDSNVPMMMVVDGANNGHLQHVNEGNYNKAFLPGQQIFNNNNYVQNVNITVPTVSHDPQN